MKTASPVHSSLGTHSISQLYEDLHVCSEVVAHHANFDISILRALNPFWNVGPEKVNCTMARAQALALPGGLDQVCTALGISGKDKRGRQLVMATCKPQRDGTLEQRNDRSDVAGVKVDCRQRFQRADVIWIVTEDFVELKRSLARASLLAQGLGDDESLV